MEDMYISNLQVNMEDMYISNLPPSLPLSGPPSPPCPPSQGGVERVLVCVWLNNNVFHLGNVVLFLYCMCACMGEWEWERTRDRTKEKAKERGRKCVWDWARVFYVVCRQGNTTSPQVMKTPKTHVFWFFSRIQVISPFPTQSGGGEWGGIGSWKQGKMSWKLLFFGSFQNSKSPHPLTPPPPGGGEGRRGVLIIKTRKQRSSKPGNKSWKLQKYIPSDPMNHVKIFRSLKPWNKLWKLSKHMCFGSFQDSKSPPPVHLNVFLGIWSQIDTIDTFMRSRCLKGLFGFYKWVPWQHPGTFTTLSQTQSFPLYPLWSSLDQSDVGLVPMSELFWTCWKTCHIELITQACLWLDLKSLTKSYPGRILCGLCVCLQSVRRDNQQQCKERQPTTWGTRSKLIKDQNPLNRVLFRQGSLSRNPTVTNPSESFWHPFIQCLMTPFHTYIHVCCPILFFVWLSRVLKSSILH